MGIFRVIGEIVGEEYGKIVGEEVGKTEANNMLFPYFGRGEKRIQQRASEYAQHYRKKGGNTGQEVDFFKSFLGFFDWKFILSKELIDNVKTY